MDPKNIFSQFSFMFNHFERKLIGLKIYQI